MPPALVPFFGLALKPWVSSIGCLCSRLPRRKITKTTGEVPIGFGLSGGPAAFAEVLRQLGEAQARAAEFRVSRLASRVSRFGEIPGRVGHWVPGNGLKAGR